MQVKKFEAPTIQEALDAIKRELGPEAIILQTKKHKKGFGLLSRASVEVTAAVSERAILKKEVTRKRLPPETFEKVERLPSQKQAEIYEKSMERHLQSAVRDTQDRVEVRRGPTKGTSSGAGATSARALTETRYVDIDADSRESPPARAQAPRVERQVPPAARPSPAVEQELGELRSLVQEMMRERGREGREAASGSPAENHAFELLVLAGLERRTAHALVKKAAFELGARAADPEALLDQLAEELMQTTETLSWLSRPSGVGPRVLALIGPTGVGKTTTLAKIASEAILKKGFKVGLINLDSYKVAAFDQLATYAKILKAPFRSASSLEDLRAAVQDFQSMDLILIDTTGRSQRDPQALKEMQDILDGVGNLECALVLSATTRDGELYDCASRFSSFHPRGLIFSKLDEATTYGCISNTSSKAKLPLLYFTTGQRVPEDIEEATPERLTALILDL